MSKNKPLVTVWCPTYNHEKFIAQTIEGFLQQKVNFPIEIIIHDDASTDGTSGIIRDYVKRYPNLISAVYQEQNQFSKDCTFLTRTCLSISQGKYIALCEGDDYWIDPLKLQKQVDFLEANEDFSSCFHSTKILKNGQLVIDDMVDVKSVSTIYDLARVNFIRTCTFVFRNDLVKELPTNLGNNIGMDYLLFMLIAKHGKMKKFQEPMAVYRKHDESIWSSQDSIERFKSMFKNLQALFPYFNDDIKEILKEQHAEKIARFAVYISNKRITEDVKKSILSSIDANLDGILKKISMLIHENDLLRSEQKSLKFSLKNTIKIIKTRLKF